ncbi:hypothetical protein CC80DRAFT_465676 [Byssothecium circinans]|uniref:CCZ1/INTU/HSP4 first Longin domain-containing protein n=1 Tax=Byssothecium circinans TaxID=147558 RepID=A0A6A5U5Y5_9PLEO|nr:hypothetical protein CC80DRAFT_465676 [Byssothecium circinans]
MSSTAIPKVIPAQLSFLAIYNPSLGTSESNFHNQIVFYYAKAARERSKIRGKDAQAEKELRERENEKLRQVGLAQGMVGFARGFSNGAAVDSVETEKSRIVIQELEPGWWILASIDLTQLPAHHSSSESNTSTTEPAIEYSSREVSPPALLLQQLVRAHNVFLLHHGESLAYLYQKLPRDRFMNTLDRYWSRFASTWDVLLHGSPAVDIYGGMKLAAGGELGMGVGEEEWGSGERLVLEDYVHKTDGLVDLMVSRFGEPSPLQDPDKSAISQEPADTSNSEPWVGSGHYPGPADGTVFSGVGTVSRKSLRDLSHWIESIYCYGDHAYGVRDNPTANRRRRRRKSVKSASPSADALQARVPHKREQKSINGGSNPPRIPPPVVKNIEASLNKASAAVDASRSGHADTAEPLLGPLGDTETWMKYLTLGYGTAWGGKKGDENQLVQDNGAAKESPEAPMRHVDPLPEIDHTAEKRKSQIQLENSGYFVIGLKGDLEENYADDENEEGDWNNRTVLRTIHVELNPQAQTLPSTPGLYDDKPASFENNASLSSAGQQSQHKLTRLQPVVYVHRPFIYTFLFKHGTGALSIASFYRDLHVYFSPLHRPLSSSTSPFQVAARLSAAFHPYTTTSSTDGAEANIQPIFDLVYDPRTLTVHSSLPNIAEPGTLIAEGLSSTALSTSGWSRLEALNVHSQIIATISSTRRNLSEIERTCKTSRGWWVVWMRLPPSQVEPNKDQDPEVETEDFDTDQLREAFLVRRARDGTVSATKGSGSRFGSAMWVPSRDRKTGGAAAGWGPKGLAEGIGIDARRYVEGLLSLNR